MLSLLGLLCFFVSLSDGWWRFGSLCAHLRGYCAFGLIIVTLLTVLAKDRRWVTVNGIAAVLCLALVLTPWILRKPVQRSTASDPSAALTLFSHNVNSTNSQLDRVLADIQIQDPDLVLILEVTAAVQRELLALHDTFPFQLVESRPDNFGIALYSKLPFETQDIVDYSGYEIPSLIVECLLDDQRFTLIASHPLPPVDPTSAKIQNWQWEDLQDDIERRRAKGPVLVAADLNATPWSKHGRLEGLRWCGNPLSPTWSLFRTPLLGLPIDAHLASEEWTLTAWKIGGFQGSDHRWIVSTLQLD